MAADNTMSRSLHDVGLAAWFGGSLMGAVGLNRAAAQVQEPTQRLRVANAGWNRWTPVNLAGGAADTPRTWPPPNASSSCCSGRSRP
jgi:hypothetical protein